jgi:hypothetical protein
MLIQEIAMSVLEKTLLPEVVGGSVDDSSMSGMTGGGRVGGLIGTAAYYGSETVRELSQTAVGGVFQIIESATQVGADVLGIERSPHRVFHP